MQCVSHGEAFPQELGVPHQGDAVRFKPVGKVLRGAHRNGGFAHHHGVMVGSARGCYDGLHGGIHVAQISGTAVSGLWRAHRNEMHIHISKLIRCWCRDKTQPSAGQGVPQYVFKTRFVER